MVITSLIAAHHGSRVPTVFLQDPLHKKARHGVCTRVCPCSVINPTAELYLEGRPRSRHLLGPLVLGPLTR